MLPKLKPLIFYGSLLSFAYLAFLHQTRTLGQTALILLSIVIFTKPLVKLFPTISFFKILLVLRRELGQATAFAVLAHVFSQVAPGFSLTKLLLFASTTRPNNFIFWGFWSLVLILPLLITSNDFSTKLLKRNWFRLQKLIHPLYVFAMLHYGLNKGTPILIFVLFVLVLLYSLRFLAGRNVQFLINSKPISPTP